MVIVGIRISDHSAFISEKHEEANTLLLQLQEVGAVEPDVDFSLLCQCAGFCKLVHLARSHAISALEALTMTSELPSLYVDTQQLISPIRPGSR